MTRDEFMRDPVAAYYKTWGEGILPEWFREAWDQPADDSERSLRVRVSQEITTEANRGDIHLIVGELRCIGAALDLDEWIELYDYVRTYAPHWDLRGKIRQAFADAAPEYEPNLPDPLTKAEVIELLGGPEQARMYGVLE